MRAAAQQVVSVALDDRALPTGDSARPTATNMLTLTSPGSGQDLLLCLIEAAEVNLLVDCRVRSYCGATFWPARDVTVRMRSAVACLCVYGPDRIPPVRVRKAARHQPNIRDNFVLTMST